MKVLIACDIEGVAGVTSPEQTRPGNAEYERARRLMTAEASAAVAGAIAGGASEVLVNDSHADYRNLLPDLLDPRARLVVGKPRRLGMMAGVDDGVDAVLLVGWHAKAGDAGVLSHTISSFAFARVLVDGAPVGEAELYGAVAASFGVPVAMLSGDDAFVASTAPGFPGAVTVVVKRALGHRAADNLSPAEAHKAIEAGAREAIARIPSLRASRRDGPLRVEVVATSPVMADLFALLPTLVRVDATTVGFVADDALAAARMLMALSAMSASLR